MPTVADRRRTEGAGWDCDVCAAEPEPVDTMRGAAPLPPRTRTPRLAALLADQPAHGQAPAVHPVWPDYVRPADNAPVTVGVTRSGRRGGRRG